MKSLKNSDLYLILDTQVCSPRQLIAIAKEASRRGVDIVQLRDKKGLARDTLILAKKIRRVLPRHVLFIINDRLDLALLSGADGVHLGQEDVPLKEARALLGEKAVIGVSCQTLAHAKRARRQGADYIGFGSVFKTKTKPKRHPMKLSLLRRVHNEVHIPIFAIGGIALKSVPLLRTQGVRRIAVCRAVLCAKNKVQATCRLKASISQKDVRG